MSNEISESDISIIRNMMIKNSYRDISSLLEISIEDVKSVISNLTAGTDIITHQAKIDQRASLRVKAPAKPKVIKAKKEVAPKVSAKEQRRLNNNERLKVESARRNNTRLPTFKTIQVDYTTMRTIRIDSKTVIYAKPGEDIEVVKANFLKIYSKSLFKNDQSVFD